MNLKSSSRFLRQLTLDVDAPHLVNRPSDWSKRLKGREYRIGEDDWYELDSGKYAAPIVLEDVPVTQYRRDGSQLSEIVLKFRGHDDSGARLKERDLHFDVPEFAQLAIELPEEGDTVSTNRMRQYPLGIQVHFLEILKTVQEGSSSFLVAAPRRFGKTTLLRALEEELRQSDIWVVKPDAATPETSIQEKFVEVCELLGNQLGAHVSTTWSVGGLLPPGDAFDAARSAAAQRGKRAIYVLLDEAQALFAHKRGKEAAEQMKIRIDDDWGVERPGMVPIRFGLFGQLHLTRQLAGQLDGVFARNWRESEFQPDRIEKMLRGQTKDRMQSTRDARRLLSEAARNFHILRALLDEIRRIMIAKQRSWFLTADVAQAMETQLDLAIRLRGPLVSFLLDPLNASENLTVWRPVAAFPVAIAWALALAEENLGPAARLDRARVVLTEWIHQFSKRFIIPLQRVEDGLRSLRDLDVLDHDNAFRSRLLERYFLKIGRSKTPLRESVEEQALQSITIDEVPVPEGLEEIGSGGQATVYKGEVEGRESAVRVMELAERDHRITFIETCYALKAIEGTRKRAIGYFSLPLIRQAGLAPGTPARGVIVYDFVHGSDLTASRGQFEEPAVVSIGLALAEALSVLEQRGVVHRDIRAENVVLQPSGVPVLVDFGLARLLGTSPVTPLHHPGVAPEAAKGIWTGKSDVFALSWMLQSLLAHFDETTFLGRLLLEARNPDHQFRCSPGRLAEQLRSLADQLNLEFKRHTLEVELAEHLRAIEADVVQKIGEAHLPSIVATVAGFFRRLGMLQHVAHFLDDLLSERTGRHLTNLAPGKGPDPLPGLDALRQKESAATGYLRHSFAHGNSLEDNLQKAANTVGVPTKDSYEPLRNAVLLTAQRLEHVLQAPGLHAFTADWIKRCEPPA